MTRPHRSLRIFAVILGLALLPGCATLSQSSDPSSRESLRLARLLRDNGNLMASYEIYGRLDRKGGLDPRELLEYASVANAALKPQDALPLFVRARKELSDGRDMTRDERLAVCLGIGRGRLALNQPEGAVAEFNCALEADQNNVQAINGLGVALSALGRTAEANESFARALDIDPSNSAARNNLALAKLGVGETESAIRLLEAGDATATPTLALNLALAHLLQGDRSKAQSALEKRLPGIRADGVLDSLEQNASRIRNGESPATELLAASRTPIALESR